MTAAISEESPQLNRQFGSACDTDSRSQVGSTAEPNRHFLGTAGAGAMGGSTGKPCHVLLGALEAQQTMIHI